MASKSFVSIEDFSTAVHRKGKEPKTKGWTEIPIHTIFRILSITKKVSVYGPCFLIKAESATFDTISFFGSKSFVADFEKGRKPNHSCYFISLGQEVHQHTHHLKNRYFLLFLFLDQIWALDIYLTNGLLRIERETARMARDTISSSLQIGGN